MGGGYVNIDKDKTTALKEIVAITSKAGGSKRSEIICKRETYKSGTTSKTISERIGSGKKTKRYQR